MVQLLQKKNYKVIHIASAEEGIRLVDETTPNMVIFDTKLPDLRSMELIERLQRNPAVSNIPCVVLSSHSDPEEMQACLQAGCAEYYVKSGMVIITLIDDAIHDGELYNSETGCHRDVAKDCKNAGLRNASSYKLFPGQ